MASATRCASSASSPSPASIACSVSARHSSAPDGPYNTAKCARKDPSRHNRTARRRSISRQRPPASSSPESETRPHVGHLHAGVVDIVLHFHRIAARAQHAHESIAQHGIAQMPDMRGFVRIDIRVLDDDLARRIRAHALRPRPPAAPRHSAAVEADIDISVACDFHRRHARDFARPPPPDPPRFSSAAASDFGQLKRNGNARFHRTTAAAAVRAQMGVSTPNCALQTVPKRRMNCLFQIVKHGNLSIPAGCGLLTQPRNRNLARFILKPLKPDLHPLTRQQGREALRPFQ